MSESTKRQGARRSASGGWGGRWGALVGLGLLVLSGCKQAGSDAAKAQAQAQQQAPVVLGPEDVVRVEQRELQSGPVLSGTLQARRAAAMRAEVQGAVLEMAVEQGQRVKKGQLLARIEDTSLQNQLLAARTAVRLARNALQVARSEEQRNRKLSDKRASSPGETSSGRCSRATRPRRSSPRPRPGSRSRNSNWAAPASARPSTAW